MTSWIEIIIIAFTGTIAMVAFWTWFFNMI